MDNFGLKEGFARPKSTLQVIKESEEEILDLNNEQKDDLDHVSSYIPSVENMELTFFPDFICHDFTNFQYAKSDFTKNDVAQQNSESFLMDITTCDPIERMTERPTEECEPRYFDFNITQERSNTVEFDNEMELTVNVGMDDTLFLNETILTSMDESTLDLLSENVNVYNKELTNLPVESAGINIKQYNCRKSQRKPIEQKGETSKNIAEKEVAITNRLFSAKDTDEIDNILLSIKPLFQQNSFDSTSNLLKLDENVLFIRYLFQCLGSKTTNSRGKIIQDVPQSEIYDELFIDNLFKDNYDSIGKSFLKHNENKAKQNMQLLSYVNPDVTFNLNRILINLIPPMISMSQIKWLHTMNISSLSLNLKKIQSKDVSPFIVDRQQTTNLYSNCKIIMHKKSLQCTTEDTEFKQIEDVCNKIDEAIGEAFSYKNECPPFATEFVEEDESPHLKLKNKKNCKDDNKHNKQGLLRGYFSKMGRGMLNKHDKGENKENNEIITEKRKKPQPVLKDINEFKLFSLLKKVKEKEKAKLEKKEPPTPNSNRKKFWTLPANNKITRRNQHVANKDNFQTKDGLIKRNWDFLRETFTKKLN